MNTMRRLFHFALFGILFAPAVARAQSEEVVYYHTDAIGSVRMVTDPSGTVLARYDYTPFGQPWNPPGTVEAMQFAGKERELQDGNLQDVLDHFVARDFLSFTGRFTTPDDPAYMDPFSPQSMNRFAYAWNNPLRLIDPAGLDPCPIGTYDFYTCVEGRGGTGDLAFDFSRWMFQQIIRELTSSTPGVMGSSPFGPPMLRGSGLLAGSVRNVNPLRSLTNCINCAIATDATLAGRAASALPSGAASISLLESFYGGQFVKAGSQSAIEAHLISAGPGARVIIFGSRGPGQVGHVFNGVNQRGIVRFLDGQTGTVASFQGFRELYFLRTWR